MNSEELRKAQLCQLELAKEVKRICTKNNISYSLAYGTLLGAVRHGGFIPWDDDLDIALLREEYDKFIQACADDLSPLFFLQTFDSDPYYGRPFAKLVICNSIYKQAGSSSKMINGVYIDIFPIDNAPKSKTKRELNSIKYRFLVRLLQTKQQYSGFLSKGILRKSVKALLMILSNFVDKDTLKRALNNLLIDEFDDDSKYVYNLNTPYPIENEVMERAKIQETGWINFEGEMFECIKDYDYYLKKIYGDYMTMPPENERNNRHQIVEFEIPLWIKERTIIDDNSNGTI